MKKMLLTLLALLLLLCPLAGLADGLSAQLIQNGDQSSVLFTDEAGDTYLLSIGEDGVEAIAISSAQQEPAVVANPCWRCGESLSSGNHAAGDCGYKYHSACMDENFRDEDGHEKCPICNSCMYSSGSRHGIGYGLCGAKLMLSKENCAVCGQRYDQLPLHGGAGVSQQGCWGHCWMSATPHAGCAICGRALCNGEEHGAGGCAKKLDSNG